MLRVALIGCGVMGRRHARVVADDPEARLVAAVDLVPERAAAVAEAHGAATTLPEGLDLAIVATPTASHVAVAGPLLARGVWCLVEKPVATSADEAGVLAHPRCLVGHCERFNPAVRAGRVQGPVELSMERVGPWTGRGGDIDVIADLMVHDLDLLLGWAPGVRCVAAYGERGPSGRLDRVTAELRGTGIAARVTADRMGSSRRRQVHGRDATGHVRLDLAGGRAERDGRRLQPVDGLDALAAQWRGVRAVLGGDDGGVPDLAAAQAVLRLAEAIRDRVGEGGGAP